MGEGRLAVQLSFRINAAQFQGNLDEVGADISAALSASANMIASMMKTEVTADIQSAGKFGSEYTDRLSVTVDGLKITTKIDAPGAALFEHGGTIHGKPLLWLPISGTDAEGIQAKDYGDKLFSVNRLTGGVPLLFSIKDRAPKYFGISSVNIPKKFHIAEIEARVMTQLPQIFNQAIKG